MCLRTVSVRDPQKRVKEYVDGAQADRMVITRRGKPAAVPNPMFWKLIRTRRRQPTLSLEQARAHLRRKK